MSIVAESEVVQNNGINPMLQQLPANRPGHGYPENGQSRSDPDEADSRAPAKGRWLPLFDDWVIRFFKDQAVQHCISKWEMLSLL